MVSTAEISDRPVIKCIQTANKDNTRSNFQAEQTQGLEQGGIDGTGRKQAQKRVQQVK